MTDSERIAQLERQVERLIGITAGQATVLSALGFTHHNPNALRMAAAVFIEAADAGAAAEPLTQFQRDTARSVAEILTQEPRAPRTPKDHLS